MYFHQEFEKSVPDNRWAAFDSKPITRPEAIINVKSIAYVEWEHENVDKQIAFLEDFGLIVVKRTESVAYLRCRGSHQYSHIIHTGKTSRFLGHGYFAKSLDDLHKLSSATNTPVTELNAPGGGKKVRLVDPAGWNVDVVFDIEPAIILTDCKQSPSTNTPISKQRINQKIRPNFGPSQVTRLGHVVLQVEDFQKSIQWYMRHLGHIPTDVQVLSDATPMLIFFRLNRGDKPADHHTLVIAGGIENRYEHSAYEVVGIDDLGQGNNYLKQKCHTHAWGIGRHLLGSQMFDYWRDPAGFEHEHYCDGDFFDSEYPTQYCAFTRGSLWLWGNDLPPETASQKLSMLGKVIRQIFKKKVGIAYVKRLLFSQKMKPRPWLK